MSGQHVTIQKFLVTVRTVHFTVHAPLVDLTAPPSFVFAFGNDDGTLIHHYSIIVNSLENNAAVFIVFKCRKQVFTCVFCTVGTVCLPCLQVCFTLYLFAFENYHSSILFNC